MLVLPFEQIDRGLLPIVGGKAGNLGELTRAGLPVPHGFCLTTDAYGEVAGAAGLEEILAAVARAAPTDVATLTTLAGRARQALLARPPPRTCRSLVPTASRTPTSTSWARRR